MTEERQPTTEKLAKALEKAGAPAEMIQRAHEGYYDDYKSDLIGPIYHLVDDANQNNLPDIASRAIAGEFDAERWEADEWFEREGKMLFPGLCR